MQQQLLQGMVTSDQTLEECKGSKDVRLPTKYLPALSLEVEAGLNSAV